MKGKSAYLAALSSMLIFVVAACSNAEEERACNDVADAIAEWGQRCGHDYQAFRKAFLDGAVGGSCDNVDKIRDEDSLRETCIPSFKTLTCSSTISLDPSCKEQLQRYKE